MLIINYRHFLIKTRRIFINVINSSCFVAILKLWLRILLKEDMMEECDGHCARSTSAHAHKVTDQTAPITRARPNLYLKRPGGACASPPRHLFDILTENNARTQDTCSIIHPPLEQVLRVRILQNRNRVAQKRDAGDALRARTGAVNRLDSHTTLLT